MQTAAADRVRTSTQSIWIGRVVSFIPAALLIFSGVMKLMKPVSVVQGFAKFGYPESQIVTLGIIEIGCTIVYLIPRTAVLGAILMVGYLGGATASNVRIHEMWWPTVLLGVLVWLGLYLRDPRLRELVPLRKIE